MPTKGDHQHDTRTPEIKRPNPRRLFSFDSVRSSASNYSRKSSDSEAPRNAGSTRPVNPFDLSHVQEHADEQKEGTEDPFRNPSQYPTDPWDSPEAQYAQLSPTTEQGRSSPRLHPVRPLVIAPARSGQSASGSTATSLPPIVPPPSNLWENLRQHVLTPPIRPSTPPQRPGSSQSNYTNHTPHTGRSTTPKPSKLGRLGFKHVVEGARVMQDDTRRLGEELLRACTAARYGEVKTGKDGKEHHNGSTPTAAQNAAMKLDYLRPRLSIASFSNTVTSAAGAAATGPSLQSLHRMLAYHSANEDPNKRLSIYLPHESRILSTLLCPFLIPTKYPIGRVEEEQMLAIESFGHIVKSWTPLDESAIVERCLWCMKAAGSLSPSPRRTMILTSLYRLVVPGDRNRSLLTPFGFQSLSSGFLLLLVALYRSAFAQSPNPFNASHPVYIPASPGVIVANFQRPPHPDISLLQDIIQQFLGGSLGELEDEAVELMYGAEYSSSDTRHSETIRREVFLDSLVTTLEYGRGSRDWLLSNVVEEYWPIPQSPTPLTNLRAAIWIHRLETCCRLFLSCLQVYVSKSTPTPTPTASMTSLHAPTSTSSSSLDTLEVQRNDWRIPAQIVNVLQSRLIPEAEALDVNTDVDDKVVYDTRCKVARLVLEIVRLQVSSSPTPSPASDDVFGAQGKPDVDSGLSGLVKWAVDTLAGWYRAGDASPWQGVLEKTFSILIISSGWDSSIPILASLLRRLPDDLKQSVFSALFAPLNDQLVEEPPPYPSPDVSAFLTALSRAIPRLFFKPLFACAASDKEVVVVNHLCTIQVHAKYIEDYWTRDVEMLCVALLSDIGMEKPPPGQAKEDKEREWGVARLGQLVLLIELIGRMQMLRHERDAVHNGSESKIIHIIRFVIALETRIWLTIEAKERKAWLPSSQRMLFCMLFREFRLYTRSLKPAAWLSPAVQWFDVFCADEHIGNLESEVTSTVERVQGLYMAAQEGVQQIHKRNTTTMSAKADRKSSFVIPDPTTKTLDLAATFVEHRSLIDSLSKGYVSRTLKLFVALSTLITNDDCQKLGPILWRHCLLDNADPSTTASACFLIMQSAEKCPDDLLPAIEIDLHASDDLTRLEAIRRIAILVNWRFQLITQNFLTDRTHRPFKLARPPLPFVSTDLGTSLYVHMEVSNDQKDKDDVPLELKKRLAELGWVEEDATVIDSRKEWIKTPLSILPASQMDRLDAAAENIPYVGPNSPLPSPQPSPNLKRVGGGRSDNAQQLLQPVDEAVALLRRNSSSGGPLSGVKRRAVFVPSLGPIFTHLAALVYDSNVMIAAAARTTLLDTMRSDPALLVRPILDHLTGEDKDIKLANTTFTALMHVRRLLPPPLTHFIFNNLAGFFKLMARQTDDPSTLEDFGKVIPVTLSMAMQVSGMTMREVRRSKMEHIFIPSGSLWFPSSAPKGPMFPRGLGDSENPFEPLPPRLVSITMIRASQNLFFLGMLKRNYQDVQTIRKNMSRLVLPSLDNQASSKMLDLRDYMPKRMDPDSRPPLKNKTVEILSLMVSRSYIMLVAQIFRSMPRHLSDRHELAILVDGLNRTLLAHGDDINIVSQVLIALMVASTRFRRLFMTGGGYTLFIPAIVKVYTETPSHPGIRSAIEYATSRFYALHKEAFLYQSINTIGQMAMLPDVDVDWFSKGVFDLFSSLRKESVHADMGGIHDANKAQEREALILHTADETPQTFLSAIVRVESQTGVHMSFKLPDEFATIRLGMDDFVKMFLTVIAHDLTIARAQHFLRLLRFLAPHLYNSTPAARVILSEGIVALGQIFTKAFAKPKGGGELPKPPPEEPEEDPFLAGTPGLEELSKEKTRIPSDNKAMRYDYLQLVLSFGNMGGQVSLTMTRQALDVAQSLLKDWSDNHFPTLATFLGDFVKMLLNRDEAPTPKGVVALLQELSPILHAFLIAVDFTSVFETVLKLVRIPAYAQDSAFSQVVVTEICTAGLAACDLAASENQLMLLQYRPILIQVLAECIFLREADVIGELEKRPPTHHFLAGVILPLTLAMSTRTQIIQDSTRGEVHRTALVNSWVRLLFYAMAACEKSRREEDDVRNAFKAMTGSFRSKPDNRKQEGAFWRSHLPTFMTALQVIKVIIVRGSDDIAMVPRLGVWERLAAFFGTMLAEGNAEFALKLEPSSGATTPAQSPRNSSFAFEPSTSGPNLFVSTSSELNVPETRLSRAESMRAFARPRLVDYALWSMFEFVCAFRSPLRMQLKLLMIEKIIALNHELGQQPGLKRPISGGLSPYPSSPSSRRLSSIGAMARKRASGLPLPSPDSSPYLAPITTTSSLMPSPSLLEIPTASNTLGVGGPRRPGYAISPVTPNEVAAAAGRPKILHLGPTSPSAFASPTISSPLIAPPGASRFSRLSVNTSSAFKRESTSTTVGSQSKATKIRNALLVKETYRRIRGVQAFFGYTDLLPLPGSIWTSVAGAGGRSEVDEAALDTWTRPQALVAVVEETKALMEEFEESFGLDDEEPVIVDNQPDSPFSAVGYAS